ncbi:hypothetical protein FOZ61_003354 [Perkinsus olseni]|uniref:Uncharacterized protein n=1 Tax=Perkinsus olseni TaxID=32597 RepID=A0A7J6LPW9_PEROL|nr:hypothetical protein FOZ61_003354 [Perkinsus olseni]KAF4666572.1 hypothetical protein FOL46_003036 [Perkinsus olseni]
MTGDLHISPIGKSLYLRLDRLVVVDGGYMKVRHLIMESYDGFYSRVPIPAEKHTAGVGYGTSNLHTWGEASKHGAMVMSSIMIRGHNDDDVHVCLLIYELLGGMSNMLLYLLMYVYE